MDSQEIKEKIDGFLVDEFEVDGKLIEPHKNLNETLELDSLDYVDLVVEVERNFGFKVKPEDFSDIKTFQDFYDYVGAKVNSN